MLIYNPADMKSFLRQGSLPARGCSNRCRTRGDEVHSLHFKSSRIGFRVYIGIMEKNMVSLSPFKRIQRVILGLYRDNGKKKETTIWGLRLWGLGARVFSWGLGFSFGVLLCRLEVKRYGSCF